MRADVWFLISSIILSALGQILLKCGVDRISNIDLRANKLFQTLFTAFTDSWILLGLACFMLSMVLWLKVIATSELSKAYPSVSLSYIIVFIFSIVLFNESVSVGKVAGLFSIVIGIILLQR